MSKPKYQIELELQGEDLTGYFGLSRFIGATTLVAEGDWISDLLQDATVFTSDQDGGEGPTVQLQDLPYRLRTDLEWRLRERFRAILTAKVAKEIEARGPTPEQRHHADMFHRLAEITLKSLPGGPLRLEMDPRTGEIKDTTRESEGSDKAGEKK